MISAIYIFNAKGDILISRAYKSDIKRSASDFFRIHVLSSSDIRSPITTINDIHFLHVQHENIYLVAATKANPNIAIIFEFLYKIISIGKSYFLNFNETAVKSNFTLIYELMDGNTKLTHPVTRGPLRIRVYRSQCLLYTLYICLEICDFGFPQVTETDTLKLYITTEGVRLEKGLIESSKIAIQATGAVSWRRPDIKYRKNEAFLDIIESVNLIMSSKGTILRSDVSGQVVMKAYLSGMPECKLGLNDRVLYEKEGKKAPENKGRSAAVEMDDCQFHQCVKLGRFDSDRIINFIPPDGEFELMRYRMTENINLPFKVNAVVNEVSSTRVEFRVAVKALFGAKVYAQNVILKIPVPLNTNNTKINVSSGKAKYQGSENCIVWKISKFQGGDEFLLSAEAELTTMIVKKAWSRPPISMEFQVLMFTASGLLVRFLKIFEKSNYNSVKWVRYMTKGGSYQIRVSHYHQMKMLGILS